jgi:hypothetical protein
MHPAAVPFDALRRNDQGEWRCPHCRKYYGTSSRTYWRFHYGGRCQQQQQQQHAAVMPPAGADAPGGAQAGLGRLLDDLGSDLEQHLVVEADLTPAQQSAFASLLQELKARLADQLQPLLGEEAEEEEAAAEDDATADAAGQAASTAQRVHDLKEAAAQALYAGSNTSSLEAAVELFNFFTEHNIKVRAIARVSRPGCWLHGCCSAPIVGTI